MGTTAKLEQISLASLRRMPSGQSCFLMSPSFQLSLSMPLLCPRGGIFKRNLSLPAKIFSAQALKFAMVSLPGSFSRYSHQPFSEMHESDKKLLLRLDFSWCSGLKSSVYSMPSRFMKCLVNFGGFVCSAGLGHFPLGMPKIRRTRFVHGLLFCSMVKARHLATWQQRDRLKEYTEMKRNEGKAHCVAHWSPRENGQKTTRQPAATSIPVQPPPKVRLMASKNRCHAAGRHFPASASFLKYSRAASKNVSWHRLNSIEFN